MERRSILAIGAHPDDVVLGLGGSIAALAAAGHSITVLTLSSGELGGDPAAREQEDALACLRLGVANVVFGRLADGAVSQRDAFRVVERALAEERPQIVFVHDPKDTHHDHARAGRAVHAAARDVPNLFFYEGPSTAAFAPHASFDVRETWAAKLDALRLYESQAQRRLANWAEGAARFRAWPRHPGGMVEAFRVAHADLAPIFTGAESAARREDPALLGATRR